jgi:spore maturation protein CgeB
MVNSVVVAGASPDWHNRNAHLRSLVSDGFKDAGVTHVANVPLGGAQATIEADSPKLVVCFGSCMPDDTDYSRLRKACDRVGACLAFWLHDDPYELDFSYRAEEIADIIFTNDRAAALHYDHPHVVHLPLAASAKHHFRPVQHERDFDVFFCGVGFPNRIQILKDLRNCLARYDTRVFGDEWPVDKLPFARNRRLSPIDLADYYATARVSLNLGRNHNYGNSRYDVVASTPGPRTFEAAMAGAVQLMFVTGFEIEDYFEVDKEILLFDTIADVETILADLTEDPDRVEAIGRAAQTRCMSNHTYGNRAETILRAVEELAGLG